MFRRSANEPPPPNPSWPALLLPSSQQCRSAVTSSRPKMTHTHTQFTCSHSMTENNTGRPSLWRPCGCSESFCSTTVAIVVERIDSRSRPRCVDVLALGATAEEHTRPTVSGPRRCLSAAGAITLLVQNVLFYRVRDSCPSCLTAQDKSEEKVRRCC